MPTNRKTQDWFFFVCLVVFWGSAFALTKIMAQTIPPITGGILKLIFAVLVTYPIMRLNGQRLPEFKLEGFSQTPWFPLIGVALFANAIPFVLMMWGLKEVSGGMASIYNGLVPVATLVFAHFFVAEERMTSKNAVGFLLALMGIIVLMYPSLGQSGVRDHSLIYDISIIASALFYGGGLVIAKKVGKVHPLSSATAVMILATLLSLPFALVFEQPWTIEPSTTSLITGILLGVFATGLASIVFFYAIKSAGPSFVSFALYLVPIYAIFLGAAFMGEAITWNVLVAMALVIAGMFLSQAKKPS